MKSGLSFFTIQQAVNILEVNGYTVQPISVKDEFMGDEVTVNQVFKNGVPVEGVSEYTGENELIFKYANKVLYEKLYELCTESECKCLKGLQ